MGTNRFSVNLFSNVAYFACSILAGLWFTPYLIRHLGVAGYGLIPLATAASAYLSILNFTLNTVTGRSMTVALERKDDAASNRVFNTVLFSTLFCTLLLVIPAAWLSYHAHWLFRVPPGLEQDFRLLLGCTAAAFLLMTAASPFEITSFSKNRFDLRNAVLISALVTRLGWVILAFSFFRPRLWHVGAGILMSALVTLLAAVWIWRHLTPQLHIAPKAVAAPEIRQLSQTGGWVLLDQIGMLLILQIDLIVVNRLLGPVSGGLYASVLQWSLLLRNFAMVVAGIFGPTLFAYYARGDFEGLVDYARGAVKFMGLVIALPVSLICGFSRPLLQVWLGPDFVSLAPLLTLMTAHLCFNLSYMPLLKISLAVNRVRVPGLVQAALGAVNLGLAWLLAGPLGWGMAGVAAAGAVVLTVKNMVFTPLYAAHVLEMPRSTFYKEFFPLVALTGGLSILAWGLASAVDLASWGRLITAGLALAGIYVFVVWCNRVQWLSRVLGERGLAL